MKKVGEEGVFELRDKVGQVWARNLKKDDALKSEYAKLSSKDERAKFRADWAKHKFSSWSKGKAWEQSYAKADITKGTYMTFGGLVLHYGGWQWKPAIAAARRTALRCSCLGGDWIQFDKKFSGLAHYLVLQRQYRSEFATKWAEFERSSSSGGIFGVGSTGARRGKGCGR